MAKWIRELQVTEVALADDGGEALRRLAMIEQADQGAVVACEAAAESIAVILRRADVDLKSVGRFTSFDLSIHESPSGFVPKRRAAEQGGIIEFLFSKAPLYDREDFGALFPAVEKELAKFTITSDEKRSVESALRAIEAAMQQRAESADEALIGVTRLPMPTQSELQGAESRVVAISLSRATWIGKRARTVLSAILGEQPCRIKNVHQASGFAIVGKQDFWFGRDHWELSREEAGLQDDDAALVVRRASDKRAARSLRLRERYQTRDSPKRSGEPSPKIVRYGQKPLPDSDAILTTLLRLSPREFEALAGRMLISIGLADVVVTGESGDGGVDARGVMLTGELLRVPVAVQVKRWSDNVQAAVIRDLRGALRPGEHGLVITTSDFTAGASQEAMRPGAVPIHLIAGHRLAHLLHSCGLVPSPPSEI